MDRPEMPEADDCIVVRLPVGGMHCLSCVLRLESALEDVPGVVSASVDMADADATVFCRPGAVSREELVAAIMAAGYRVRTPVHDGGAEQ